MEYKHTTTSFFLSFQRGQIFVIDQVLAGIKPELYVLKNLKNVKLKPKFYKEQLRLAPDPAKVPFEIEQVLDERMTRKNGKELYVRNVIIQLGNFHSMLCDLIIFTCFSGQILILSFHI